MAVEYADDVSVVRDGQVVLKEQDKHSLRPKAELLADRSRALWRTLQIWLTPAVNCSACKRFLLVTNNPVSTPIASMLKAQSADGGPSPDAIVRSLRAVGGSRPKSRSQVQSIIDDVLNRSDNELARLVARIEVVEARNQREDRAELADALSLDPRLDPGITLEALLGWLTNTLLECWRAGRPGMISRAACIAQRREIEDALARRRLLPKPAREVPVAPDDRARASTRPFVHHLTRIDADEDDVLQAIDHFIQFNIEKNRLASDGEIADREWRDRGERLKQRWLNIKRQAKRDYEGRPPEHIGIKILERSTYDHLEPIGSEPCRELYMTSGHYHRLADDDQIWWHPDYRPRSEK
ncbi:hypothetical protein NLM33_03160 [Bradyrhizobium sp. CCGUVB1N3]|uniref:ABC-three component system protein n=1 Tax=Bradyrhizobium sp. CCGUVB1N3 TaxID=2949629 RepID=UPI0020B449F8|nr:ABC-three component system protein [Bradyrhizobium sp. CCGUVB1N3]MCP3469324.1 hypothetical protein [Bradyrhizobium sp. CCGUVB1N3]